MKRLIIVLTIVLMALTLSGCDDESHPNVKISPTIWTFDELLFPLETDTNINRQIRMVLLKQRKVLI